MQKQLPKYSFGITQESYLISTAHGILLRLHVLTNVIKPVKYEFIFMQYIYFYIIDIINICIVCENAMSGFSIVKLLCFGHKPVSPDGWTEGSLCFIISVSSHELSPLCSGHWRSFSICLKSRRQSRGQSQIFLLSWKLDALQKSLPFWFLWIPQSASRCMPFQEKNNSLVVFCGTKP